MTKHIPKQLQSTYQSKITCSTHVAHMMGYIWGMAWRINGGSKQDEANEAKASISKQSQVPLEACSKLAPSLKR